MVGMRSNEHRGRGAFTLVPIKCAVMRMTVMRVTIVVVAVAAACRREPEIRYVQVPAQSEPKLVPAAAVEEPQWWCTSSTEMELGVCDRLRSDCEEGRSTMAGYGPCVAVAVAYCYMVGTLPVCAPTLAACRVMRDSGGGTLTPTSECQTQGQSIRSTAATVQPSTIEAHWWCVQAIDDYEVGYCERSESDCQRSRERLTSTGIRYSECKPHRAAACYRRSGYGVDGTQIMASCSSMMVQCRSMRDYALAHSQDKFPVISKCEVVE